MTAPTEAEIRVAIAIRLGEPISGSVGGDLRDEVRHLCLEAAGPMTWPATFSLDNLIADPVWGGPPSASEALYGLLSREEALALRSTVNAAAKRAAVRCESIIFEELTAAGVQFAQDHPDAPRAVREPVPA